MLRSVTPHTKVQLDTVDAGLAERMIGVDEGGVREEGFEGADVFLVRECLVPVRDVRRVDASQWRGTRVPFKVDVRESVVADGTLSTGDVRRNGAPRFERHAGLRAK